MAKAKTHTHNYDKIESTLARTDDGSVQITFTIPNDIIAHEESHALSEMALDMTIPGFRKGKAPIEKVKSTVSKEKLLEKTLMHILPHAFSEAVNTHKIRPALYPRFEILAQGNDETPWQIRAVTAEIPEVTLGDYKTIAKGALKANKKPARAGEEKELTKEQLEEKVILALLDAIKINIPKVLVDEEVNARLAQLLERIEKLGLNLDGYLSSIGKDIKTLREEYEFQTKQAISLELILNKIAEVEKVTVSEKEVADALAASQSPDSPQQKQFINSILKRRAVLDHLIGKM